MSAPEGAAEHDSLSGCLTHDAERERGFVRLGCIYGATISKMVANEEKEEGGQGLGKNVQLLVLLARTSPWFVQADRVAH